MDQTISDQDIFVLKHGQQQWLLEPGRFIKPNLPQWNTLMLSLLYHEHIVYINTLVPFAHLVWVCGIRTRHFLGNLPHRPSSSSLSLTGIWYPLINKSTMKAMFMTLFITDGLSGLLLPIIQHFIVSAFKMYMNPWSIHDSDALFLHFKNIYWKDQSLSEICVYVYDILQRANSPEYEWSLWRGWQKQSSSSCLMPS